jgi:hypothetical protein
LAVVQRRRSGQEGQELVKLARPELVIGTW